MIDTNNILASKPIQVVQEVSATVGSEKTSDNFKHQQSQILSKQVQSGNAKTSSSEFSSKMTEQVVNQLNEDLKVFNTRVSFSIDDTTKKTVVKIIDNSSGDVIKQIPPEYLLKVSQRITELLGLVVDEKA